MNKTVANIIRASLSAGETLLVTFRKKDGTETHREITRNLTDIPSDKHPKFVRADSPAYITNHVLFIAVVHKIWSIRQSLCDFLNTISEILGYMIIIIIFCQCVFEFSRIDIMWLLFRFLSFSF